MQTHIKKRQKRYSSRYFNKKAKRLSRTQTCLSGAFYLFFFFSGWVILQLLKGVCTNQEPFATVERGLPKSGALHSNRAGDIH